jgi:hypothetical protein
MGQTPPSDHSQISQKFGRLGWVAFLYPTMGNNNLIVELLLADSSLSTDPVETE